MLNEEYDDHNYYVRFIVSQLEWRHKLREYIADKDAKYNLYENGIISAIGLRASGATTAIQELFVPGRDLYVGINKFACEEFKKSIEKQGKPINQFSYLNFNAVDFDNTNMENDLIATKISNFFESNGLIVMEVKSALNDKMEIESKVKQVDIDNIKNLISRRIIEGDGDLNELNKIRGKFRGDDTINVYIDIGSFLHREYGVRVNRLMKYLRVYIPSDNLVFILT